MTEEQKMFITKKLIPFILREQGCGFDMQVWNSPWDDYSTGGLNTDGRKRPSCGTVFCIGGSIEYLLDGQKSIFCFSFEKAGKRIGLDRNQSRRLFSDSIQWPEPYRRKFLAARTPLRQSKVAVSLLKEIVRTDGEVL